MRTKKLADEKYPTLKLDEAIEYLKRIAKQYEGTNVIAYDDIGKAIRKSGGNLSRITHALSQYGLLEKGAIKKWRITDLGKAIITTSNSNDVMQAFLKPSLFATLYNHYKGEKPSPLAVEDDIKKLAKLSDKKSKKYAKVFIRSFDFVKQISAESGFGTISPTVPSNIDKSVFKMAVKVGKMFSEFIETPENDIKELKKFADDHNMRKLSGQLDIVISNLAHRKNNEEKKEELKKHASLILKTFEEELDII